MKKVFDWKKEIAKQLRENFGDDVKIEFDESDNPSLIFHDDASQELKETGMAFVTLLWEEMGGKVEFHPELERQVGG